MYYKQLTNCLSKINKLTSDEDVLHIWYSKLRSTFKLKFCSIQLLFCFYCYWNINIIKSVLVVANSFYDIHTYMCIYVLFSFKNSQSVGNTRDACCSSQSGTLYECLVFRASDALIHSPTVQCTGYDYVSIAVCRFWYCVLFEKFYSSYAQVCAISAQLILFAHFNAIFMHSASSAPWQHRHQKQPEENAVAATAVAVAMKKW